MGLTKNRRLCKRGDSIGQDRGRDEKDDRCSQRRECRGDLSSFHLINYYSPSFT